MMLDGSCRCGGVSFRVDAYAPVPYMRCYCSICRKVGGGGGYAINLGAYADSLAITGEDQVTHFRATIDGKESPMHRAFCSCCGAMLWARDPRWPNLVHPFASAIDTALPAPPHGVHIMLDFKPAWVMIGQRAGDRMFPRYPDRSLDEWHRDHGLYAGR